ncbi:MAG: fructose 1,6-bisphosphatase [Mycobacterium leprae]
MGNLEPESPEGRKSMLTLSVIKADTGGFVGHTAVHPDLLAERSRCTTSTSANG